MAEKLATNAIVLRCADYREHDRMLTLFSPELGAVEALCRGCRRQNSPLLPAGEPFASGEFVLWRRQDRFIVSECRVSDAFYPLREDYERLSHGMYLLELTRAAIQPEQENARLFLLLLKSLAHLAYGGEDPRRVTAVFLVGICSLSGFRPVVGRCTRCARPLPPGEDARFSVAAGGLRCAACPAEDGVPLSAEEVAALQAIRRRGLEALPESWTCTDRLFSLLRAMAEDRLETDPRAGRLLQPAKEGTE